jgi:hypothetical protein
VTRARQPGPATREGLRWLASVGPSPLQAWALAMGWQPVTARSHLLRLVQAGLVDRCAAQRGEGPLIFANRAGVQESGVEAAPIISPPAPTTWAHWQACAWTAAWLTARGRHVVGSRELLIDEGWEGELEWLERGGWRRRGHRPDLAAALIAEGPLLPIEVELAGKSTVRLRTILALHASWIAAGKTPAVIYVCSTPQRAANVLRHADHVGLSTVAHTLRVEVLDTIRQAALDSRRKAAAC